MWPDPQEAANLVTFTEEILNEKLHFLCRVTPYNPYSLSIFEVILHFGKPHGKLPFLCKVVTHATHILEVSSTHIVD